MLRSLCAVSLAAICLSNVPPLPSAPRAPAPLRPSGEHLRCAESGVERRAGLSSLRVRSGIPDSLGRHRIMHRGCRGTAHRGCGARGTPRAGRIPAGITERDLPASELPGRQLVIDYCDQCHGLPSPAAYTPAEWTRTVERMFRRMDQVAGHLRAGARAHGRGMRGARPAGSGRAMRHSGGGRPRLRTPSEEERGSILAYLRSEALTAPERIELPTAEGDAAGRALFARTCSRCHALPSPARHTAAEWRAVVDRMRGNMRIWSVPEISDRGAEEIVAYLERAARSAAAEP